jgi:hypothetical protein
MRLWWQVYAGQDATPIESEAPAWIISLMVHVVFLFLLAAWTFFLPADPEQDLVLAPALLQEAPDAYRFSDDLTVEVGALGQSDVAQTLAAAPLESELPTVKTEVQDLSEFGDELVVADVEPITAGPNVHLDHRIRGISTIGETGAMGAVDRITHEILLSLEQRPTLVVWLFDQSGSLQSQREAIADRFDRIYEELGIFEAMGGPKLAASATTAENPAFARHQDTPLLSAVVAFGANMNLLTRQPTADVEVIKQAVRAVENDTSGAENVFQAVYAAADRHRAFHSRDRRNVMIVVFTDEAGDDVANLERAIDLCRRQQMPVYVVGAPAPFGRQDVYFKWVDPDPNFDQSPQWMPVHQGPESLLPERLRLRFAGMENLDEPIDSGFGPYGLTRLCYETGGLYFAVHPNRTRGGRITPYNTPAMTTYLAEFFDPLLMRRYQPDYIPVQEYQKLLTTNRARAALVQAAQVSWTTPMEDVELVFPVPSEAALAAALTLAQREAARVEPKVLQIYEILRQGEADRAKLIEPRWQAGYDLAMGRTLAVKVRTEGYNAMLAKAKQGMKFENERNDTWVLRPEDSIETGSTLAKQAEAAREYLTRVMDEHANTPWAFLAARELETPLGWTWRERYTGVRPPPNQVAANNTPQNPTNDQPRQAPPQKPRRDPPAL